MWPTTTTPVSAAASGVEHWNNAIDPIRSLVAIGTTDLNALRDPDAPLPVPSG